MARLSHEGRDGNAMPPVKFAWIDIVVLVTTTATGVAAVIAQSIDQLDDMMRAHANYLRDRREAFDDMMKDIESL